MLLQLIDRHVVRRSALAAIALTLAASAVLVARHASQPPVRVAIRVSCDPPAACALAESLAIDVWSEHQGAGLPLDVVVWSDALDRLAAAGVSWQVLVPDIDAVAAAEARRLRSPAARTADWFAEYHDYRAITAHLGELAERASERATLQVIGNSLDNRPIWAIRIGPADGTPMLINSTLHAREWIAPMVATCVADRLIRDYDRDPAIRAFVDHTRLWIVPVANPDGYQYSWSSDRYWR
ncbi:MAG: hypothetical protein E6J90_27575, partial [Deltaproteobacteria bacterium]